MPALARKSSSLISGQLIALLEEARQPRSDDGSLSFGDRLDALEVEAIENCVPDTLLLMVRAAREALEFGERIVAFPRRA